MEKINLFVDKVKQFCMSQDIVEGVAVAGSFISKELDKYSDIDFVIILKDGIQYTREEMIEFANQFGPLLSAFTGEHVGEKRLLICLYEDPFLHVDYKFIQLSELRDRVENPIIIYQKNKEIDSILESKEAQWPNPDFQWIEDRFWVWIHYAATKLGRGEYFETIDFLSFLRGVVLGPLLHLKNKSLPRGVRKLEFILDPTDLEKLRSTIPAYDFHSLKTSLLNSAKLYNELKLVLYGPGIKNFSKAETYSLDYLNKINK
ncbi:nucleotidyltransferase domain-containing protein [Leptospira sarikeiensis]|uniref:Nucleotidyltransferase domain-containing protein n=1 Tax=Leptospira sarikeiensis TaxID=2484943 RepID=A0A4R9KE97_9LEPT|nr:nucleotidyltransferase domain-containing protein [Leptospira sarikeiensis]TGL63512.1 nucleotidyltransferase domain-containing protein [Leptospira sarikeiensis]